MVNLDRPGEHRDIAELARNLATEVLGPAAREAEEGHSIPAGVWRTLFGTGLAVPVPPELGGDGVLDALAETVAVENLAYGDPAITVGAFWSGAGALLLSRHGTADQASTLAGLGADWRGSVALYEGYGRSPAEYATTVETVGDTVRVRGTKFAVPFAAQAAEIIGVDTDPAGGGLRAVVVPVGAAVRAVDYAADYAKDWIAFGKPILAFQGVSFPLAEAVIRNDTIRLEDRRRRHPAGRGEVERAAALVTDALAYAATASTQATRDALQILGGHGFITDHPVELWYRSAAALSALDLDPLRSTFKPAL